MTHDAGPDRPGGAGDGNLRALLWFVAILAAILAAWRVDRVASALLWPYLGWVSFATVLNASIWWLNK